ncbi:MULTISPECIES: glycosyltransferase family 4 protein [unclassified Haematospirillum]|uniref:glycosyltransferase family 4 protein n=1 Tax=unclassified Haematospirillum TaxID=2622088 RepID=UPI0014390ABE|nr:MULTISPECIES: glycosyltransferase family 4 protein [unclassified Haematospirillum]NKD55476.1 glycosyltransferase family 4 protein [Haematospirillum sp. H4890]NKD75616.1 glycosyltransferase family 4 protein [Haematospirillum sp. H4485]NKD86727.1 glycosyltransferase family 4 protein [Haematospirillum sp. 15-248]
MRLMLVTQSLRPFGSGQDVAVWRLVRALASHPAVRLTVVTAVADKTTLPPGIRLIRLPTLPVWHGSLRFLTFLLVWWMARRWLRRGMDYVLLDSPLYGGGDAALVHFLSSSWYPRLAVISGLAGCVRYSHERWRHWIAMTLEHFVLHPSRAVFLFPVSTSLALDLVRKHGISPDRIHVVPNASDPYCFVPAISPPKGSTRILFVGGAWHRKRLDLAIMAIVPLANDVVLDVVGAGPVSRWMAFAERAGVGHRVIFHGLQRDVVPFYQQASVVLIPSDYETDGLVGWEALCCAVPVVATPSAAVGGWLVNGVTGIVAETVPDMTRAVQQLLANPDRCRRMGRVGRWLACRRAPDRVVTRLLARIRLHT